MHGWLVGLVKKTRLAPLLSSCLHCLLKFSKALRGPQNKLSNIRSLCSAHHYHLQHGANELLHVSMFIMTSIFNVLNHVHTQYVQACFLVMSPTQQ